MSKKNYNELIIDVLSSATKYAEEYDIKIEWEAFNSELVYDISEMIDDRVTIYFDMETFSSMLVNLDCNDAIMMIYTEIYSIIANVICNKFVKCKKITALYTKSINVFKFASSFCEKYSGIKANSSELRCLLETTNSLWKMYNIDKNIFPAA